MIKSIKVLKNFGIFQDYTNSNTQDFGKYNLFYGWNGSGKSTLSSLFRCLENHSCSINFPSGDYKIKLENGSEINPSNIESASLNIYTFNQDFINEHISWNEIVKSILVIDKTKISERDKLNKLKQQQLTDQATFAKETQEIQKLDKNISEFQTNSARRIKTSLQTIDTSDSYYFNYDKRKLNSFIEGNPDAIINHTAILNDQQIVEHTNAAKPNQKNTINLSLQTILNDKFTKAELRLRELLKTSIISQVIKRLADNEDVKTWVETGIELHRKHKSDKCEFCGAYVGEDRIKQLEGHFNDNYKAFQERLTKADKWLEEQFIKLPTVPVNSEIYEELNKEYLEAKTALENSVKILNDELSVWQEVLKNKIGNPLETNLDIQAVLESSILSYNTAVTHVNDVITKHNNKTNNFKEETTKAKKRLELHYASTEIKDYGYFDKQEDLKNRTMNNKKLNDIMNSRKAEIIKLEELLSNESLGASQFNEKLGKFLGRNELTLRFNLSKKGYEIYRNGTELIEGKLSEGEKTAIAFIYFITKLHENDNKIEDTIIIVDDPVSSFDSNHLFHAYSFLRNNCENAKQIFVLTHNFTYFKLIRDWFEGVNKNRKRSNPSKNPNAFFYTIEASTETPRKAIINNADASLIHYNSEYHYIFLRIYEYKDKATISRDDSFLIANLLRKLLESFFSFKYPKYRGDLAALMDCGLKECTITDKCAKEKIYRFINKYSHSALIEVNEETSDNLIGESYNVIQDVFKWMEEVDRTHYKEMLEVCNN